jgi:lipopolysaccharide biosynthesis glycosyltransferase
LNIFFLDGWNPLSLAFNLSQWVDAKFDTWKNEWKDTPEAKGDTVNEYAAEMSRLVDEKVYILHYAGPKIKPWQKPNINNTDVIKLSLFQYWNRIANETNYLSQGMMDRVKEMDDFIKDFGYSGSPRVPKEMPVFLTDHRQTTSLVSFL